jgi:hypothetical protein
MWMALRRAFLPLVLGIVVAMPAFANAGDAMESKVFGYINGERSKPLIEHPGLLSAARQHSQEMASRGGLDHDGADARANGADPDFEPASWCENVTYSTGFPESEVAQRLYEQWRRSAPHQRCMTNEEKNVGAVGIYFDGSTWWATFIAEVDRTPPGGAAQSSQRAAPASTKPEPPPKASAPATTHASTSQQSAGAGAAPVSPRTAPSAEPEVVVGPPDGSSVGTTTVVRSAASALSAQALRYEIEVGRWDTIPSAPRASRPRHFGLREVAVAGMLIGLTPLIAYRRSTKRLPEVERRDAVPLPEVELVGAGSLHT